jgi:hypothetical protein
MTKMRKATSLADIFQIYRRLMTKLTIPYRKVSLTQPRTQALTFP